MSEIVLDGVTKRYGDEVAVADVDLTVRSGELFVLVGPSGCGKTTLLRIVAGLEQPTSGEVFIDGERVTDLPARKRHLSLVFQDYALFPHMAVRENLSFNLRMRGGYDDVDGRVASVADLLGIADLLDRSVDQLSGGQKQRVALGRAIAPDPRAFLLDEPFANLDENLREGMRDEIVRLHEDLDTTTIHVTHDQREALSMGDRIGVLRDGSLKQVGSPEAVYERPETRFVAGFIGTPTMNLLEGRYDASAAAVRIGPGRESLPTLPLVVDGPDGTPLAVGVRPEHVHVEPGGAGSRVRAGATVERVEFQGADRFVHLVVEGGYELVARVDGDSNVREGQSVAVDTPPGKLHVFDADTGLRLATKRSGDRSGRDGRTDATVGDAAEGS